MSYGTYGRAQKFQNICKDDQNSERKAHEFFRKLEEIEDLKEYTFESNSQPTTPLHIACKYHNASVLRVIFQYGCNPNKRPVANNALHDALEYDGSVRGKNPTVKRQALRKHKNFWKIAIPLFADHDFNFQDVNHEGQTLAHICAKNGLATALKQMPPTEVQKMLHRKDHKGWTPIRLATHYKNPAKSKSDKEKKAYGDVLKVLLEVDKNDFSAFAGSQSSSTSKPRASKSNRSQSGTSSMKRTSSQSSRPRSGRISAASTSHSRQKNLSLRVGDRVEVLYGDGNYYGAYISKCENNEVWVYYDDFGEECLMDSQIEGCKAGKFYPGMLVMSPKDGIDFIHVIEKSLPNEIYEVKSHDERSYRLKGNQMRQVLIGDEIYAPFPDDPDDPNVYKATIMDIRVQEKYVDVQYKEYSHEPDTSLNFQYFSGIYTIKEWDQKLHKDKMDAQKAEEERKAEQKRKQRSEESRRRREHSLRQSQNRESVDRQVSRGSSSHTTQSSARESVFGASVERSVPRSQSAASSQHYQKPPPPTKEEEEDLQIPDEEYYAVLALLPEMRMRHDEPRAWLAKLKSNGIANTDYFWTIMGKLYDWVVDMYEHYTKENSNNETRWKNVYENSDKEWRDKFENLEKEVYNFKKEIVSLKELIHSNPDQLPRFLQQNHEEMERLKREHETIISQFRTDISNVRQANRDLELVNQQLKEKLADAEQKMKTCAAPPSPFGPGSLNHQLETENEELKGDVDELKRDVDEYAKRLKTQKCFVCCDRLASSIAVPCGHFHYCSRCEDGDKSDPTIRALHEDKRKKKCIICKGHVDQWIRVNLET